MKKGTGMDSHVRTIPFNASVRTAKALIAIPARLASTRLPNKLLLEETGRPLLAHVLDRCLEAMHASAGLFTEILLAYDDEQLGNIARSMGIRAIKTRDDHRCGTTRIAEAVEKSGLAPSIDIVVNVQGDEPELAPGAILGVAEELVADPAAPMATLAIPMPVGTSAVKANPNAVKVVLAHDGRAIYFSRCPIPYDRNPVPTDASLWHHHLGVYAYRTKFLLEYAKLPPSPLEEREGLEQLRAIEAGHRIMVRNIPAEWAGKGIDTPEDYQAFVRRIAA